MDAGAWWAIYTVHGVPENRTQLSDFTSFEEVPKTFKKNTKAQW